jgi:hypothetical protein
MKNTIIALLILISCCGNTVQGQSAYYDAFTLKSLLSTPTLTGQITLTMGVRDLLSKYYGGPLPVMTTQAAVDAFFITNPFFRTSNNSTISIFALQAAVAPLTFSSAISSVGGLDVTSLADGFAKFLVKRTKEELSVTFFDRFRKIIHEPGYEDVIILFPQTCAALDAIGEQIYNYGAYINMLRESFEKDLNGLLSNLPRVINDNRYNTGAGAFFVQHPELKSGVLSMLYVANSLMNKEHPGKILADYDVTLLNSFDATNLNIKASVQTLQLVSESLRSKDADHYWINSDSLRLLVQDPVALQIYLGLIYQKAGNTINFDAGGAVSFQTVLSNLLVAPNSIAGISAYIQGLVQHTSALTDNIKNISGKKKEDINFTDYYQLYSSSLDLFEYATQINVIPGLKGLNTTSPVLQQYVSIARATGNIAFDINRKNYSSAVLNAYQVYSFVFAANGTGNSKVKSFLLQYGSFAAAISQAQNSDDVEKAIEAVALPSGSSRVKRETPFNVAINAYTGLFYGHESIQGIKDSHTFNSYGVTAPVGVSISRGHSILFLGTGQTGWKDGTRGWSTSLFISLIDLGAVAAFRFKDDTTAAVPSIQLKHIFSPGAFISIGIPKTPLSVNLGAQMGPNLRKVYGASDTQQSNDYANKTYWRYSVSFCADLPLLNLYTQSKAPAKKP